MKGIEIRKEDTSKWIELLKEVFKSSKNKSAQNEYNNFIHHPDPVSFRTWNPDRIKIKTLKTVNTIT